MAGYADPFGPVRAAGRGMDWWYVVLEVVMHEKRWQAVIFVDEHDGSTYAEARLQTGVAEPFVGIGRAHVNPVDADVPEIGDELAVARALADLGNRLLVTAARDIEQLTREEVRLRR